MADQSVPILTKAPEDTTTQITTVMTELVDQTKFLSNTLNKNIKSNEKIENKKDKINKKNPKRIIPKRSVMLKKNPEAVYIADTLLKSNTKTDNLLKPILAKTSEEQLSKTSSKTTNKIESLQKSPDITKSLQKITEAGTKSMKFMQETFLGDISFITGPFKDIGGIFKSVGSGLRDLFGKKKRIPPKRSAMLKTHPESVYITDTLLKGEKKDKFLDKFKGLFKNILPMLLGGAGAGAAKAALKKILPKLATGGAITAIAAGVIWMAIDGIRGAFKAKEWGVSKLSGAVGGILGGMGSGVSGAFKNMGKFALIGAGIGTLITPVIGTLIGGLIGAAVGAILGYIGGKKIAKAIQSLGKWFIKEWGDITKFFINSFIIIKDVVSKIFKTPLGKKVITFVKNVFDSIWAAIKAPFLKVYDGIMDSVNKIKDILSSNDSIGKKVGEILVEIVAFVPKMIINWFTGLWSGLKGLVLDMFTNKTLDNGDIQQSLVGQFTDLIMSIGQWIGPILKNALTQGFQVLTSVIQKAFNFLLDVWSGIKEGLLTIPMVANISDFINKKIFIPIGKIFTTITDGIVSFMKDPAEFGKQIIEDLLDSIKEIFVKIKDGFLSFLTNPLRTAKDVGTKTINDVSDKATNAVDKIKSLFGLKSKEKNAQDAIIKPNGNIINTNPKDTIIATKNPVAFADKESNLMTKNINSPIPNITKNLENLIKELISKQSQPQTNNMVQQNITSRYNPQAIMANLTTEVF